MTCPDNLLVGSRKGTLTAEEQERLDAHIRQCSLCRLTLAVGQDFDAVLEMSPGDELIAARIARGPRDSSFRKTGRARRASFIAIAAAGVIAGAGLAAAAIGGWQLRSERVASPAVEHPPAPPPATVSDPGPERAPPAEDLTGPAVEPSADVRVPAPSAPPPLTAAELFAKANASRSEGHARRALSLYSELQSRYPGSAEAEIAHVSLGRVMLELGQSSGALGQFDQYLSRKSQGPLAQEALFGKASALSRLGRLEEERRTWETLLARFPKSVYRDRANDRLGRPR